MSLTKNEIHLEAVLDRVGEIKDEVFDRVGERVIEINENYCSVFQMILINDKLHFKNSQISAIEVM